MSRSTRRGFVQQSALLGLGLAVGLTGRALAANDKISIACLGVRGRGNSLMHSFAAEPDCVIAHICDVNEPTRRQGACRSCRYRWGSTLSATVWFNSTCRAL